MLDGILDSADGVLLKPDRPAFPPNAFFLQHRGKGEVQLTATHIGAGEDRMGWSFCLSFAMGDDVELSAAELGLEAGSVGVAWRRSNLEPFQVAASALQRFGPGKPPLSFAMQPKERDWGLYTYWRTAPTSCDGKGWTLLGEMEKLISVSPQRVTAVETTCGSAPTMRVDVAGQPGEKVALSFLGPEAGSEAVAVTTVELVLATGGTASASCHASACSQQQQPSA